jgi:electron transport complex protein RnfC
MNNKITIPESMNVIFDKDIHEFLNPDHVYIPIEPGFELNVKTGAFVYMEQVLLSKDNVKIYSPVSGKILGKTTSMKLNNKDLECIVIENDFKESLKKKTPATKYINEYSKDQINDLIVKFNAIDRKLIYGAKTLVINGIDKDPFEHTSSYIINTYSDKILETIDALASILGCEETILAINNADNLNVINLINNIGTYPNIKLKLVPDIYPIGFESILLKNTVSKKQEKSGVNYLTVEDIYNIYNVLKRKKPITEKLITIAGNAVENPKVVKVKIGTSMADIIKNSVTVTDDNYYVIINGLLAGKTLTTLNNIITPDIRSIFLNTADKQKETKCIQCGLCNLKCPAGLNPKYLKEHKKADKSKCIHCGLCTYLCPANINFKKYLGGNENE